MPVLNLCKPACEFEVCKRITFSNLKNSYVFLFVFTALASRCLEVVTLHIATFKSHFELRLPPKQYVLLGQFDQILKVRDYEMSQVVFI